ncbi:MAG: hypothetical protein K0V04_21185 [Deltaproteobacteria bacterium]|nr:hypothetical protein [Deltaproteobacteria bacterium]
MPVPSVRSFLAGIGAAVLITATHGCSYLWTVTLDIEIADDVDVPELARLIVVQTDQASNPDQRDPADAPWGVDATEIIELGADQRTHRFEGATCCSPVESNSSWAFLDLDRNGTYDEGEPYAADPNNPVEISADYAVTLVIQNSS